MILTCNCQNEYQDKRYGKGRRVMNLYYKPSPGGYRCTVCGSQHSSPLPQEKSKVLDKGHKT